MSDSNALETFMAQQHAAIGVQSVLYDDVERGLSFWARPECEDGGRPDHDYPFGWTALCSRIEKLKDVEFAFPNLLGATFSERFEEGC